MPQKHDTVALSTVSKDKKAVIHLTKKILVLDKLHLSMSSNAVGHNKVNVNESTICIK